MIDVASNGFEMLGTTVAFERLTPRNHRLLEALLERPSGAEPARTVRGDGDPNDVLAALTAAVVETSPLLCLHAAVVAGHSGLIAVPGESGLGKTTLAAALVRVGFAYVSDEALAMDRATGEVFAFPRPLALDGRSWQVLGLPGTPPPAGVEQLVPANRFGRVHSTTGSIDAIVLAERGERPVRLTRASRGEAVTALLPRCFNHFVAPEASFHAIVSAARGATVWRASYADATEMAAMLAERLLGHSDSATRAR